jgi:WD40 repeat protein
VSRAAAPRLALGRLAAGLLAVGLPLLALLCPPPAAAEPDYPRSLVNNSHPGRIDRIAYNEARQLLFTIGEDGTTRVWSPEGRIQKLMRVSRLPLKMLAVHPDCSQFAVVESDLSKTFRLSVWDTRMEMKLFDLDLDDLPLFLYYSSTGKYLVYGRSEWDGLVFLDTRTWRKLPLLQEGVGVVSFAVVSRNERNIMIYQPSGWITYLEIETGRVLKQARSLPELSAVNVSPDNVYMAAAQADDLVVVDLLSGELVARSRLPGVQAIAFSPGGDEITCITRGRISRWYFDRNRLYELYLPDTGLFDGLTALAYAGSRIYLTDQRGSILYLYPGFQYGILTQNHILELSDLALAEGVLAAAGPRQVICIFSDFLSTPEAGVPSTAAGGVRLQAWANPFPSAGSPDLGVGDDLPQLRPDLSTKAEFSDDRKLFLWKKDDQPGAFTVLDLASGQFRPISGFSSPLAQFDVCPEGIVTIEKSGLCQILDRATFETVFQYWAPGMNRLIFAGSELLIGGKSAFAEYGSPLLRINRWTGETVSIPDSSAIVYDLLFDSREGWLFSLGVDRSSDRTLTLLKMHYGVNYTQDREIFRYEGEDLNAALTAENDLWTTLYFTIGGDSINAWNGYRFVQLEPSPHVPYRLYSLDKMLFALNQDSTITVWDTRSRRILLHFYIFKDMEWAALLANGLEYTSPGGGKYLVPRPTGGLDYSGF